MIKLFNVLMTTVALFFSLRVIADLIFKNKNNRKRHNKKVYFAIGMASFLCLIFFITIGDFKFKSTLPLLRANLEGLYKKKLCDIRCKSFPFAEGKIIVLEKDSNSLYSISLSEENEMEDLKQKTMEFSVKKNKIYFTNVEDHYCMYSYNLSNKKVEKITEEKMIGFILLDEYIFYCSLTDKLKLYCYNLKEKKSIKISNRMAKSLQVVGDNIYFHDGKNDFKLNLYNGENEKLIRSGEI